MKHMKLAVFSVMLLLGVVSVTAQPVAAINLFEDCKGSEVCKEANDGSATPRLVQNLITTLLYIIGVIAVIVIIVGGIKYATSDGDSSRIASAKNTILYAVIGLVVALLAYAIVNFVVARL